MEIDPSITASLVSEMVRYADHLQPGRYRMPDGRLLGPGPFGGTAGIAAAYVRASCPEEADLVLPFR
jgi:hypothetical protein